MLSATLAAPLAASAVAAFGTASTALIGLHLLPTGLRPMRDPVSAYGRSAYAGWYRFQVVATGIGALVLVGALAIDGRVRLLPLAGLAVFGAARIAIAWNPMDLPGEAPTASGRNHGRLAGLAFIALAVATVPITTAVLSTPQPGAVVSLLPALSIAVPLAAVAMVGARVEVAIRGSFGLVERVFYVAALSWLIAVALALALGAS